MRRARTDGHRDHRAHGHRRDGAGVQRLQLRRVGRGTRRISHLSVDRNSVRSRNAAWCSFRAEWPHCSYGCSSAARRSPDRPSCLLPAPDHESQPSLARHTRAESWQSPRRPDGGSDAPLRPEAASTAPRPVIVADRYRLRGPESRARPVDASRNGTWIEAALAGGAGRWLLVVSNLDPLPPADPVAAEFSIASSVAWLVLALASVVSGVRGYGPPRFCRPV